MTTLNPGHMRGLDRHHGHQPDPGVYWGPGHLPDPALGQLSGHLHHCGQHCRRHRSGQASGQGQGEAQGGNHHPPNPGGPGVPLPQPHICQSVHI